MKRYLFFCIIVLLLIGIGSATDNYYAKYYRTLDIQPQSGWSADLTNQQMYVDVYRSSGTDSGYKIYVGSKCRSDYTDIFFTDSELNILESYIEEAVSSTSDRIWFKLPTISNTSITRVYMFYGNTESVGYDDYDGDDVFDFYDTFNGASLDPTKWASYGNIQILSGDRVRLYPGTIYTLNTFGNGYGMITSVDETYSAFNGGFSIYASDDKIFYSKSGLYINNTKVLSSSPFFWSASTEEFTILERYPTFARIFDIQNSASGNTVSLDVESTLTNYTYQTTGDANAVFSISSYYTTLNYVSLYKTPHPKPTYNLSSENNLCCSFTPSSPIQFQNVSYYGVTPPSGFENYYIFSDDSSTTSDQNTTHNFIDTGTYTVSHGIYNSTYDVRFLCNSTVVVSCSPVIAAFTTNVTNGDAPLDVAFTSTSTNATSWEWDFDSDGDIDSTDENPNWTYPSVGFWSPTLVVYGNGTCEDDEVKEDYIYVSMAGTGDTGNLSQGYGYQYPPKDVRFKVMTMFGEPIDGCSVIAQGITTTTGSWDWLIQLFGVSLNETPIMNTNMAGTTDSNGEIVFLMIPSVKYNMSFYRAGEINQLFYITPKDEYYNIYSTTGGESYYEDGYDYNAIINITLSTTDYGADDDYLTITYTDTLTQTTDADIYIYLSATTGESLANSTSLTPGGSFTESLLVEDTPGHSYHVRVVTTHDTFGVHTRDFIVTFPDTSPNTFGFPSELLIFFAIFILIFVGMFFGAASATAGSLVVCFVGWILYAVGWLNSLGATAPVALSAATAFSIFAIIAKAYREDR